MCKKASIISDSTLLFSRSEKKRKISTSNHTYSTSQFCTVVVDADDDVLDDDGEN